MHALSAVSVHFHKMIRRLKTHRPIQEGLDEWKRRISIQSYSVTKLSPDLVYLPTRAPPNSSDVLTGSDQTSSILTCLCYSCRTTLTSRGSRASKPNLLKVIHNDQTPSSAPLPVWTSVSYTENCTQDKQFMVSGSSELWVRELQDEAVQRNKISDFLLDT